MKGCKIPIHTFPKDADRRQKWLAFLNRKNIPKIEHMYVRGEHFITGRFTRDFFEKE